MPRVAHRIAGGVDPRPRHRRHGLLCMGGLLCGGGFLPCWKRGCLVALGLTLVCVSQWGLSLVVPRAWQTGGLSHLPPFGYAMLLMGLAALVLTLPRRLRWYAGLGVILALALFLWLWPWWEVSSFPHDVKVNQIAALARPDGLGQLQLCIYSGGSPFWVLGPRGKQGEALPSRKVNGFYAEHLSVSSRLAFLRQGFTLRPVWPGGARTGY
ncbi:MAG: hypothetical protein K6T75_02405 [Acetobacteraceae bacterium]|nr:hypothetical protein [Acetobacteraceae bacterium]